MRVIERAITVSAPAGRVWSVLTDFAGYQEWNPFMPRIEGALEVGARLSVRLAPPGGRAITMRPTVVTVEPERRFSWLGRLGVPGIFDGEHEFVLTPEGDGTRFVQRETFRGVLVPLTRRTIDRAAQGFDDMNRALAARATGA
jgi:hypothetical protein